LGRTGHWKENSKKGKIRRYERKQHDKLGVETKGGTRTVFLETTNEEGEEKKKGGLIDEESLSHLLNRKRREEKKECLKMWLTALMNTGGNFYKGGRGDQERTDEEGEKSMDNRRYFSEGVWASQMSGKSP